MSIGVGPGQKEVPASQAGRRLLEEPAVQFLPALLPVAQEGAAPGIGRAGGCPGRRAEGAVRLQRTGEGPVGGGEQDGVGRPAERPRREHALEPPRREAGAGADRPAGRSGKRNAA